MDYSLSWFTAWMPAPQTYFTQIIHYIPNTLDFMYEHLQRPIVTVFAILCTVLGFLFAIRK